MTLLITQRWYIGGVWLCAAVGPLGLVTGFITLLLLMLTSTQNENKKTHALLVKAKYDIHLRN